MKINKYPFFVLSSLVILSPFSNGDSVFAENPIIISDFSNEDAEFNSGTNAEIDLDSLDFSDINASEVYAVNNFTKDNSLTIEAPEYISPTPFELTDESKDYSAQGFGYSRTWTKKTETKYWGKQKRASKLLGNCGLKDSTQSIGYSRQESWSANISLSLPDIKKINATVGYTVSKSESTSSSVSITVPRGYVGWIEFRPLKYKTTGTFYNRMDGLVMSSENLTLYSPKRLKGELDGIHISKSKKMTTSEKKKFCSNNKMI